MAWSLLSTNCLQAVDVPWVRSCATNDSTRGRGRPEFSRTSARRSRQSRELCYSGGSRTTGRRRYGTGEVAVRCSDGRYDGGGPAGLRGDHGADDELGANDLGTRIDDGP